MAEALILLTLPGVIAVIIRFIPMWMNKKKDDKATH